MAREEAHRLRGLAERGQDPRELERIESAQRAKLQTIADAEHTQQVAAMQAERLTVGEVWTRYTELRRPFWGALQCRDHLDKAKAGGLPSQKRGGKFALTKPGPLACLMPLRMVDLTQERIEAWAAQEGQTRPSSARLAWRLLTVFLTWCAEQPEYVETNVC